jgi:hypothetical protein
MCGRVRLSSDVSEIKLVFSIPPHGPPSSFVPKAITGTRRSVPLRQRQRSRETGHLVEQVSVSIVFAFFSQDHHGDKAGSDFLNPAGVFQNAICRGHQTTHPSK